MNPPHPSSDEIFEKLLDESSALLAAPQDAGVVIPDDDLHREILLPLLPAMLGDEAIRKHWHDQAATGFLARLTRHLQGDEAAPLWQPADFEIHVTASYSAGPDAKALADTLLSEDSLRDMSAALMNQVLAAVWPTLELSAIEVVPAEVEVAAAPVAEPVGESIAAPAGGPVAEPIGEPVAAPVPELLAEPLDETVAQPVGEPVNESLAEPAAETVAEPVTERIAEPVPESAVEAAPLPNLSVIAQEAPPVPAVDDAASSEIQG